MALPTWEEIDYETIWTRLEATFGFRPGMGSATWPTFDEPINSVTYGLAPCWDGDGTSEWARQTVNSAVVWAMAGLVDEGSPLLVLDWQHQAYRFWPHRRSSTRPLRITPVPDGDYHIFLTENFSTGSLGHPWEETLCVFGAPLLERVSPLLAAILPVLRTK